MTLQRAWILLLASVLIGCAGKSEAAAENGSAAEAAAGRSTGKDAQLAKPDAAVIAAWEEAGAEFGWMGVNEFGYLTWRNSFTTGEDNMPTFKFDWHSRAPVVTGLPQPEIPLAVCGSNVTDTGLKELARLT